VHAVDDDLRRSKSELIIDRIAKRQDFNVATGQVASTISIRALRAAGVEEQLLYPSLLHEKQVVPVEVVGRKKYIGRVVK
jgi:hypothetical protein